MKEKKPSIFKKYTRDLFASKKNATQALKDHPQVPIIIDSLSRKENHHVVLTGTHSDKIQYALLESLAHHLTERNVPKSLRDIDFIYFDAKQLLLAGENTDKIAKDFLEFQEEIRATDKRIIFATNQFDAGCFGNLLHSVLSDARWRVIVLGNDQEDMAGFTSIKLSEPTTLQLLTLLKTFKTDLENYHHVLIPEETCASALSMTKHYLTTQSNFDKALELLDSAASRASSVDYNEPPGQFKPIVTNTTLAYVISTWTQIPITHLHTTFQAAKFIEVLQRSVFGQDAAITAIGSALQHACVKLQEKSGPLRSFLLVGPAEVGKKTAANAMAEHLFGHNQALFHVDLSETYQAFSEIKILSEDNPNTTLLSAIQKTPYAIILIDNVHLAPTATFNLFKSIFTHGVAFDEKGNKCDFRNAIFIMTTTLGAERITALSHAPAAQESNKAPDLMQLVLNEHLNDSHHAHPQFSHQELCEELTPILEQCFSTAALQHLHVIPFLPLDYAALEKIVRFKMKLLGKRLETNFQIELSYAPEVIKFLAHETLWRKPHTKPIEKLLEQYLYSAVATEILAHAEDKNRPKRMLLQLNGDGQLLRCEFINAAGAKVYN